MTSAQDAPFTSRPLWDVTSKTTKLYTSKEIIFREIPSSPRNSVLHASINENVLSNSYKDITPAEYTTDSSKLFTSILLTTTESFNSLPIRDKPGTNVDLSFNPIQVESTTKKSVISKNSATRYTTARSKLITPKSTPTSKMITPAYIIPTKKFTFQTPRFTTVSPVEVTKSVTNLQRQYVTRKSNTLYNRELQSPTETVVYYNNGNQGKTVYQVAPSQNSVFNVVSGNDLQSYNIAIKQAPVGLTTNTVRDGNTYKLVVYV